MQIVIDIPKEDYHNLKAKDKFDDMYLNYYEKLIVNGTLLPKGHGRLIDVSLYEGYFNTEISYDDGNHIHTKYTNLIPTIIEADTTESRE